MKEKFLNYFQDISKEMSKVNWPTKKELQESTTIVLVVCIIFAAFVYLVDTAISQVLKNIF
ncbi:MAG: preprotein translocase subunit SecE [Ignavibacteria bacterium]|nr:preprotein translocase subunit SecE [Bacteroidota bacterium]MSQ46167.1 preprotein translocase subunit SecE [Ignavibacteria bacterium]